MKAFIVKYKHAWLLSYCILYAIWFTALEGRNPSNLKTIHIFLDDLVPFHEIFVIPYYIWFGYVAIAILYFFFKDVKEYYRLAAYLISGMTICLIIYTVWPNGQSLRPTEFVRDNFLVDMVKAMYQVDTPTNVWPSIHVFNSIVVDIAIARSVHFKDKAWVRVLSKVLMVLICLSTVFIKQHSVADGIAAILLAALLYPFVYCLDFSKLTNKESKDTETA